MLVLLLSCTVSSLGPLHWVAMLGVNLSILSYMYLSYLGVNLSSLSYFPGPVFLMLQ